MKLLWVAAVVSWTAIASADPCGAAEKYMGDEIRSYMALGKTATDMIAVCVWHGPDDKAVEKLGKLVSTTFAERPPPAEARKCTREVGDVGQLMGSLGQSVGIQVGLAWVRCSTKATSYVVEEHKKGTSQDVIKAALEKMGSAWMDSLHI